MSDYPWNEKARSAQCRIRRAGTAYRLYVGDLPDMRGAAWFFRKGRRVIASGVAGDMGKALAQVEHAFENWARRVWRVYG
ncbi:hypothetical protein ACQZ6F_18995 [Rhizobium sp. A22-96]